MNRNRDRLLSVSTSIIAACALAISWPLAPINGQDQTTRQSGNWSLHNIDLRNSRYSPLREINTSNVHQLTVKWSYSLPANQTIGSSTPIVVDGMMYFNSGSIISALDASTG